VIQFFSQMLKFPVAAVAAGFEIMARVMRDMQQTFDRNVDVVADGMAQSLMDQASETGTQSQGAGDAGNVVAGNGIDESDPITQKDGGNMGDWDKPDQDLGGEDLKVVRYRIIFTKRDFEEDLDKGEETVNYPTNGGSFGGLKVAQFMGALSRNGRLIPPTWTEGCYPWKSWREEHDPPGADPKKYYSIPDEDLRYITFLYEVLRHVEREEKEYDKEQVRILRGIQERL
jgi:hypothetical protein